MTRRRTKSWCSRLQALAVLCLGLLTGSTLAQEQPLSRPPRFEVSPFLGYRTSISFPIDPHVQGTNPRVVLDASPSYGAAVGFRINEDDLVELRWARQDSYVHTENVEPPAVRQRILLDQIHGDFSHEYAIDEWRPWAKPFVMASVGATHVSGDPGINFTRFSFGIGGGVRFYASRHLAFKIQAEWLPIFVDPHVAFICGTGCIVHVGGTLSSQGEVIVGPHFASDGRCTLSVRFRNEAVHLRLVFAPEID